MFMVHGDAGTGKTFFALSSKNYTGKKVAYVGTDHGARHFGDHPVIGGYDELESNDIDQLSDALSYLEQGGAAEYGALAFDTTTVLYQLIQRKYERSRIWDKRKGGWRDCDPFIPQNSWRALKAEHRSFLRRAQALPLDVFLIAEEKIEYERVRDGGGEVDLVETGTREDADKKDRHICDVRLRLFKDDKKQRRAEVLKDRYGHVSGFSDIPPHNIVENPHPGHWIKKAAEVGARAAESPDEQRLSHELAAALMVEQLLAAQGREEIEAWKIANKDAMKLLPRDLFRQVGEAGKARAESLGSAQ